MTPKPILKVIVEFGKKHATKILAGGAILTEIAGFWMMHKEAPEVRKRLDALPKDAKMIDKIKTAAPVYLPALLMLATSGGCIIGGCALGEARLAAMTNLAMASEATLARYEQKMIDKLGKEKVNEMQQDIAKDLMQEQPPTSDTIIPTTHGTDLYYDYLSGRYFTSSDEWITRAVRKVNDRIDGIGMWAEVNDFYDELEIPQIGLAKHKGWNIDHKLHIEIGEWESTPNGRPCKPILYIQPPVLFNGHEY